MAGDQLPTAGRFRRTPLAGRVGVHSTYVTGYPDSFPVVAGMDRDVAYDIDGGTPSRLDDLAARDRAAALYHDPIGFLRAATDSGAKLENPDGTYEESWICRRGTALSCPEPTSR